MSVVLSGFETELDKTIKARRVVDQVDDVAHVGMLRKR